MSAEDDIARMKAEMDQGREGLKEFAGSLWAFYAALIEKGFKEDQALKIMLAWFNSLLTANSVSSTLGDLFGGGDT